MNTTELASLMFPFDPKTDLALFYGATVAYCLTGFYNILVISGRIIKRFIPKQEFKEVPFSKLTNVVVEPPSSEVKRSSRREGHEVTTE